MSAVIMLAFVPIGMVLSLAQFAAHLAALATGDVGRMLTMVVASAAYLTGGWALLAGPMFEGRWSLRRLFVIVVGLAVTCALLVRGLS